MAVDEAKLIKLARNFSPHAILYAVGGYSRSRKMGLDCTDLDVCSLLNPDAVKKLLSGTDFHVADRNLRVGTIIISDGTFSAEYTPFRVDSYPAGSAKHTPERVEFTSDIALDARRRDFTCNAVYYDPLADVYIDPTGGIDDIERKLLRAADHPDKVFSADGLRILRLARFAAQLDFTVDEATIAAAARYAGGICDVAPERILAELELIFVADTAYPIPNAGAGHVKGLKILDKCGALDFILPELTALKGLAQPAKYHKYDAYRHSLETFAASPPSLRWAALLHDVGKKSALELNGGVNMKGHDKIGAELAAARLTALRMPKKRAQRICRLIGAHMLDLKGDMSENKLRWYLAQNADIALDIADLKDADGFASKGHPPRFNRVRNVFMKMTQDGTPLSLAELPIGGRQLEELGIAAEKRGDLLKSLWREAVMNPALRDEKKAIGFVLKGEK